MAECWTDHVTLYTGCTSNLLSSTYKGLYCNPELTVLPVKCDTSCSMRLCVDLWMREVLAHSQHAVWDHIDN